MVAAFIVLIAVQWMPGVGGLTVPVMALVNVLVYRAALRGQLDEAGVALA